MEAAEDRPARAPLCLPLYSSKNLERDDLRGIRRLVIVLHGVKRNAASIHGTVTALFAANPERAEDTLVIAPKFASAIDAGFAAMPAWRRASWEDGELSMQARGVRRRSARCRCSTTCCTS